MHEIMYLGGMGRQILIDARFVFIPDDETGEFGPQQFKDLRLFESQFIFGFSIRRWPPVRLDTLRADIIDNRIDRGIAVYFDIRAERGGSVQHPAFCGKLRRAALYDLAYMWLGFISHSFPP